MRNCLLFSICLQFIFCFPLFASTEKKPKKSIVSEKKYDDIALFSRVLNFIEAQYVNKVDTEKLLYGAIKGMLETLDPHSNFLTPEVFKQMQNDTTGKFGGLGIEIWLGEDGLLTVLHPIEGTPAWKAGILSGDKIVKINGEGTKGLTLVEAVSKMRGKTGESIKLSIYREDNKDLIDFKIVRSEIKIKSVKYSMLPKDYAYIKLAHFQEKSAKEMKTALEKLEKKHKIKGLILDLRNNPGGLLDQAVDVANLFIDDGVIVSTMGREQVKKEVRKAKSGIARKEIPLAVLVNGNSASAAEIVAGALKDHKRALILGSRTFGKGSVQTVIPLGDDVGLKLTIAKYYTPNGVSIQAKGIEPDVTLEEVDPDLFEKSKKQREFVREADLKNHFKDGPKGSLFGSAKRKIKAFQFEKDKKKKVAKKAKILDPKEDYQVQQALKYLQGYDIFNKLRASK